MRSIASLVAILSLLALAGCQTPSTGAAATVRPMLPELPASAAALCRKPLAAVGDDLGVLAAEWKTAAVCEGGKRAAIITFYRDVQRRYAGP